MVQTSSFPASLLMHLFICISLFLLLASCKEKSKRNKQEIEAINTSDIMLSPVQHDSLSPEQVEKIKKIHLCFSEVMSGSLEETITNFKRDKNPDNEIAIWLNMASAYEKFLKAKGAKVDIEVKQEAFTLILMRSTMNEEEAKAKSELKILTDKDVQLIYSFYEHAPEPIKVQK